MTIESYYVSLVVNQSGLNDNQTQWITKKLKWIANQKLAGPVWLLALGFNGDPDDHMGLPRSVWNKTLPPGVNLKLLPGLRGAGCEALQKMQHDLHEADEVWCCPSGTRVHLLNPARPNKIYRKGQLQIDHHRYKWIPPWISVDEVFTETLKGKGEKNAKKAIGVIRGFA